MSFSENICGSFHTLVKILWLSFLWFFWQRCLTIAKALILVLVQRLPVVVVYCVHPNLSKALCLMAALSVHCVPPV